MIESILICVEVLGIVSYAISGTVVAIDKEADLFGVLFLAVMTCFGGGILRDIIIGYLPPRFFTSMYFELAVALLTSLTIFILAKIFKRKYMENEARVMTFNNYLDALGIGVFAVGGTSLCIEYGPLIAITLGMISAVGGGMVRDLILRDIPFIMTKRVYAVATLVGSSVYYLTVAVICPDNELVELIARVGSALLIFLIRVLATRFKLDMPKAIVFKEMEKQNEETMSK